MQHFIHFAIKVPVKVKKDNKALITWYLCSFLRQIELKLITPFQNLKKAVTSWVMIWTMASLTSWTV